VEALVNRKLSLSVYCERFAMAGKTLSLLVFFRLIVFLYVFRYNKPVYNKHAYNIPGIMAKKHKLHTILNLHEDKDNESLLINELARLLKRDFDRRAQKLGFTRAQWLVIGTLRRTPGLKQTELADILEVHRSGPHRTMPGWWSAGPSADLKGAGLPHPRRGKSWR
jgi:hypothetical protein